jgi:hypothetical protein
VKGHRIHVFVALAILATAIAISRAAAAVDAGVLVGTGDKITARIADGSDVDSFVVEAGAGGKISVAVAAAKLDPLLPIVRLFDPDGSEVDLTLLRKGAGTKKVLFKNFVVPADGTGPWRVTVSGGGGTGAYTASFTVKDVKSVKRKLLGVAQGTEIEIPFATAPGATISGSLKATVGTVPETLLFRE